jgi:hypothetical protein
MDENVINQQSLTIYDAAKDLVLQTQDDFIETSEILKAVKRQRDKIIEYWKGAKTLAYQAYKGILTREKDMLKVCDDAEKNLKSKILEFQILQRKRVLEICENADKSRKAEAEKLLDEAILFQANGDEKSAEEKLKEAESLENLPISISLPKSSNGVTIQKRWSVKITDLNADPAFWGEIEIREINTKKLLDIRKLNPNVKIPGVEFYQAETVVIRK